MKKTDVSDVTSNITTSTTTAAKKIDLASSLKKFETFPGAASNLSRVSTFISKNPKLAASGISGLAAAGYVAFLMSNGLSFDDSLQKLGDLIEDTIEDVVDTTTDIVGGGASAVLTGFLKGIFGENYMYYMYVFGVIFFMMIILKLRRMLR